MLFDNAVISALIAVAESNFVLNPPKESNGHENV
jgi:hypothetical protein